MDKKFSLAHLTVLGCAPPEMIYIAAMTGYDYVGIRPIFMGLPNEPDYDLSKNKAMFRATKRAILETGVKVNDIELAKICEEMDFEKYERCFETAAELGAKHVLSSIWTPDKAFYMESFSRVCEIARKYDLSVELEFVTWANVKNLSEALEVIETVKAPNSGIMVDTLHFNRSRVQIEALKKVPKEYFHFLHLCDGPAEIPTTKEGLIHTGRDERLYVGEGGIDIKSIVEAMPEVLYTLELPHIARVRELGYAEHARRCLQSAKDYLG
ncbi:sugar phosphate isomerase/epimerase family protein [Fusibacter ferrireducens]|uniref:Sugar phosphate isomerase/epimerase n=1 Tax=Fusibacter ferrireducens TaxID=2785058 RepID=A0ABR9ZUZ3_9FIRM|nr:sugar phosphate isomerase/epimerase [Fusibacter ferrireducens]MBF4694287.1 sugar phosphate isomerase/epimerase [Fusibacter ferrireducens]